MTSDDRLGDGGRRTAVASACFICLSMVALMVVAGTGSAVASDTERRAVATAPPGAEPYLHATGDALQGADVPRSPRFLVDVGGLDQVFPALLGDWWGLDLDGDEAPFIGLVELGTVVLVVGAGGYAASKRYSIVPVRYRRRTLQVHEWLMLIGTALVTPHFVFAEEIEGLGLFIGVLLGIEVLSGFYGRHLHRRVIRLSRGDETPVIVGRALQTTNRRMLSRWRRIHVSLVSISALALLVHILSEAW